MSKRALNASLEAELSKQTVRVALLVWLDFPSGAVRCHTGTGDLSYGGYTWTGAGELLSFSAFPETTDGQAQGCTVDISGVDADAISDVMDDNFQNRDAEIRIAFFDSSLAIIESEILFKGRMDTADIRVGADASTVISVAIENKLIDQTRSVVWRYSPEDQKALYPGTVDKGFDFIALIQDQPITWGQNIT